MSPLSQTRLLLPLLKAIRDLLGPGEHAAFKVTAAGAPCIEAHTGGGSMIAAIDDDGLCSLDTANGLYACDPNGTKGAIHNAIRRALNDAREEWA